MVVTFTNNENLNRSKTE